MSATRSIYITTPIYYVNAAPHLGHAYTTIVADTLARFHRMMGRDVRFQTGTDEHGEKIAQAAEAAGMQPKEYVDRISSMFQELWPTLAITHDHFIRTTDPEHIRVVQQVLTKVYEAGDIYFASYGGMYCVGCERFYTEREMVDGKCPDHQCELTYIEEDNYFFRMSKYQSWLVDYIRSHPEFIRPERYRNEVLAMLREPLEDLCISRPKKRLSWGIELPFDTNYVTYVWFDALINYISGLGWPDGELMWFWPVANHLIAKDILKPHAIFWPTMLRAMGLEPYQHLHVHGYWNVAASKMSKSLGNVVRPLELVKVYGLDGFRYFLLREMVFGRDANFTEELLVERYNADLANDLGNLVNRVLGMTSRYFGNKIPSKGHPQAPEEQLLKMAREVMADYAQAMELLEFHRALARVWELISAANKYVATSQPWELAKDPAQRSRLEAVLYSLIQILGVVSWMVWPVMPSTGEKIASALSLPVPGPGSMEALELPTPQPGAPIEKLPALFPRVDTEKVRAKAAKAEAKAKAKAKASDRPHPKDETTLVDIKDFARIQLKVGRILQAERVEGTDRLMKLSVDLGEGSPRTLVAGIAQHYEPSQLVGMQVVVVANLKPAKIRGIESQGMVLAAVDGQDVVLLHPSKEVSPGAQVR